ncbi:hypothetical protein ACQBAT_06175 [Ornithinimicrobium sp. Y1847]|uniref:hypothetical protein n=1 Tax=Ornithinimicrobium sp. Y1847 TaxID=3405419 RepID=UPI003B678BB0
MKKFASVLCGLGMVAGVGLSAPAGAAESDPQEPYTYDVITMTTDDPRAQAVLAELDAQVPGWRAKVQAAREAAPAEQPVLEAVNRAINPDDYVCGATALDAYVDEILTGVDEWTFFLLAILGALEMPTYDALLYGTQGDPDYALPGDAKALNKAFSKLKKFWTIPSADIQLIGMHGEMLADRDRLTRIISVFYGTDAADSAEIADLITEMIASEPELEGGENPIFTLNAFAFSAEEINEPLFEGVPDKIVMGEGIIDAVNWMGLGTAGSEAILAHEFAHHVQFEAGLIEADLPEPEATRRVELMADAFASYSAAHRTGLNLRKDTILKVQASFYNVGDCQFDSPGHHGTPNQRLAAATWGADLAIKAQKQGHKVSISTLSDKFEAHLPILVAPDAP